MKELFKPILGFIGYEVSNYGRVKSLARLIRRMATNRYGYRFEMEYMTKERFLKPISDKDGYLLVNLQKDTKGHKVRVHRLVAQAFIPNPENKPQVNHLNSIRNDNRSDNLEWVTSKEDTTHARRYGDFRPENNKGMKGKFGKLHNRSKAVLQYDLQGNFIAEHGSACEAARVTGIGQGNISTICRGDGRLKTSKGFTFKYK